MANDNFQLDLFEKTDSGAFFSPCGIYRYTLWRQWATTGPALMALMLNPSTADQSSNDPTVERVERRARALGFSRLVVTNIFALRATDPMVMLRHPSPVGMDNDLHILEQARQASQIILAWGTHGSHLGRVQEVLEVLSSVETPCVCLGTNADGSPKHPLYVGYNQPLIPWSGATKEEI